MVRRIHRIDLGTESLDEAAKPRKRRGIVPGKRGQKPPAVLKERGKTRPRPRIFRARHWVAGNEVHTLGNMRHHRINDRLLDRTHIGHRRAGLQMRADLGGNFAHRANRHGQHDQIGIAHSLGRGVGGMIDKADLTRDLPRFGRLGKAHDFPGQALRLHGMGHGRGDQPQPDQGDAVVDHRHGAPLTSGP